MEKISDLLTLESESTSLSFYVIAMEGRGINQFTNQIKSVKSFQICEDNETKVNHELHVKKKMDKARHKHVTPLRYTGTSKQSKSIAACRHTNELHQTRTNE